MAVTDFLFEGKPPESVKTYGDTVTGTPKWYNDYTQGLIAKANAIAAEPYRAYTEPRVAGFTDAQRQAFAMTPAAAASYRPYMQQAGQAFDASMQGSALQSASPYMAGAAQNTAGLIGQYMNPYTSQVVDRVGDLAKRQLSENIIPTIQSQFIGGGTFGGSRSGTALGRAMRDLQESTLAQQSQLMQQGYGQAASQAQADLARYAQLAQTAGALSQADLQRQLALGQQYSALGQQAQGLSLTEAAALQGIGETQQQQQQRNLDLAYQDFLTAREYPRQNIAFLNAAVRGLNIPTQTSTTYTGPAQTYQPSVLSQLAQAFATYKGLTSPTPVR
jgi:hypothetical protein